MPKVYFVNEWKQRHIEDLHDTIYGARKRLKLTQGDMADAVGKSRQQYAIDEKNFGNVKYEEVLQYLHELGYKVVIKREE